MSQTSRSEINNSSPIFVSGWNGFGQWPLSEFCLTKFKKVYLSEYLTNFNTIETFDICMEWGWNIALINSRIFIKGFCKDNLDESHELTHSSGALFTNCVCNDQHIFFYNTNNKDLWKYHLDDEIEEKWIKMPNLLETENETISKVISSIKMNVILSSTGRVFNVHREISYLDIQGKIIDIQCGHEHAMLLTDEGNVCTWGIGSRCQLGHGNTDSYDEPKYVEALGGVKIVKISANGWHCCALSKSGDLYTWGWNDRGQLGVYQHAELSKYDFDEKHDLDSGDTIDIKTDQNKKAKTSKSEEKALPNYALPVLIDIYNTENNEAIETNIIDVRCGSKHTVIKLDDGSFWGTGCNKYSQLGFEKSKLECTSYFVKLDTGLTNGRLHCGIWTTAIIP